MFLQILVSSIFVTSVILLLLFYKNIYRMFLLNKYKNVLDMFDIFCKQSYNTIYNDQIIAYTSEGMKGIPPEEYETIQRNYIKMTMELMGPENIKMFTRFYGDEKTVIVNMLIYMKTQVSNDQISVIMKQFQQTKGQ